MTPARTGTQADHWHRKTFLGCCPCFGYPDYKLKYILQSWASLYLTGSIHSWNLLTLADIAETVNQSCLFTDTLSTSAALAPHAIQININLLGTQLKIIGKLFRISGNFERIGYEVKKEVKFLFYEEMCDCLVMWKTVLKYDVAPNTFHFFFGVYVSWDAHKEGTTYC